MSEGHVVHPGLAARGEYMRLTFPVGVHHSAT
jgi:hypothetical protein